MSFREKNTKWKKRKISDISIFISRGITPKYTESLENSALVLNQRCVRDGKILIEYSRRNDMTKRIVNEEKRIQSYDILINSTGVGTLGRVSQIGKVNEVMTADSHVTIVRANDEIIDKIYLGYAVKNRQKVIENMAEGSTGQTELSRSRLGEELVIDLPCDISEQKKIANILSTLDEKIEVNNQINKTLEKMAQAIFKQWFVDFEFPNEDGEPYQSSGGEMVESELGLVPKGWEVNNIGDNAILVSRGIAPKYTDVSDQYVINQKCIRNGFLNYELSRPHKSVVKKEKILQFGDVLINSTGVGTLGRVAQLNENLSNYTVDSHITIVRPNSVNKISYLGCLLKGMQSVFEQKGTGSTGQTELRREAIKQISIIDPKNNILEKFTSHYGAINKMIITNQKEQKLLENMRDNLLPKLITGEIRVSMNEVI